MRICLSMRSQNLDWTGMDVLLIIQKHNGDKLS